MTKILIVDDDFRICRNLSEILRDEGYTVEAVTSGKEGAKLLEREKFDIAIIDLIMPEINGMELLYETRKKKPNTQVIMITAFATVENAVEAMKMGASDYISKPFKTNEIRVTVKRILEEANFRKRISGVEKTPDTEKIISSLNSSIRRAVIVYLNKGRYTFTEIMKGVDVDDPTKFNFHLRKLRSSGLVKQDEEKKYFLSTSGKKALDILLQLEIS